MYVATIAVYEDSHFVNIDCSEAESIKTMEAFAGHKGIKNVFRTVVDDNAFIAFGCGANMKAKIVYGIFGQPISITVTAH